MMSFLYSVFLGVPIVFLSLSSLVGALFAHRPLIGVPLLAVILALAYKTLKLSRDVRRHWALRRLALIAGACCALFGVVSVPFLFIESSYGRFQDWHSAGAGLRPGMTLDQARALLAPRSVVTESSVDEAKNFKGIRFQVEPTGLARYRFEFPLAELYYLDVQVDAAGRVAAVKPWTD